MLNEVTDNIRLCPRRARVRGGGVPFSEMQIVVKRDERVLLPPITLMRYVKANNVNGRFLLDEESRRRAARWLRLHSANSVSYYSRFNLSLESWDYN